MEEPLAVYIAQLLVFQDRRQVLQVVIEGLHEVIRLDNLAFTLYLTDGYCRSTATKDRLSVNFTSEEYSMRSVPSEITVNFTELSL